MTLSDVKCIQSTSMLKRKKNLSSFELSLKIPLMIFEKDWLHSIKVGKLKVTSATKR